MHSAEPPAVFGRTIDKSLAVWPLVQSLIARSSACPDSMRARGRDMVAARAGGQALKRYSRAHRA